ncbi:unnamed protein product, partial [Prorocentrum cordatum]
ALTTSPRDTPETPRGLRSRVGSGRSLYTFPSRAQVSPPITLPGAMPEMQTSSIFSSVIPRSETSGKGKQNTPKSPIKRVIVFLPDALGVGGCGDNSEPIDIGKPTVIVTL